MILQQALTESFKKYTNQVIFETDSSAITYGRLSTKAAGIQQMLMTSELPQETFVGIDLTEIPDVVAAMLGVIYSRLVFVPIDRSLPKDRLKAMIEKLRLSHLITNIDSPLIEFYKQSKITLYYLDNQKDSHPLYPVELDTYHEQDSLYVYFTSGSTGIPKAVLGKNDSLIHFLKWEIREFAIEEKTRFSQFISPFFDAFLRDIFIPILSGGTICIPPANETFLAPVTVVDWLDIKKINFVHCVPSVFMAINADHLTPKNFESLTHVLMSGERIIPSSLRNWYQTFGSRIQLVNLYGVTETTMIRTFYRIKPSDVDKVRIPVGWPIDNTTILIADENLKPCPPLSTGEIFIISDYMTKGYYEDEVCTASKFVKVNNLSAFKTGDKARTLSDGTIDLIGRDDRQIKLQGIRIDLDEIETIIEHSGLVEKIWVAPQDTEGTEMYLTAFAVARNNSIDTSPTDQLTVYMEERLPKYMLPRQVKWLTEFPLLSNGKIDRQTLIKSLNSSARLEPNNEIESKLLVLWKGILGDKPIGTDESFLSIGGHSITMMRLIGRIYKEFHVKFPLRDLFLNLTIQKQASYIKNLNQDDAYIIKQTADKTGYPLTAVQERMYVHWQIDKENTAFNMPTIFKITGNYDFERLQNSLRQLIQRHESLRTSFKLVDNKVNQLINDTSHFNLQKIDAEREQLNQVIEDFISPFNLEESILIRGAVILIKNELPLLITDIHHMACDGQSQKLLFQELNQLYNGSDELLPLPKRYRDFAVWEHNFRSTREYISNKEFWLNLFDTEFPKTSLPILNENQQDRLSGGEYSFEITKDKLMPFTHYLQESDITCFSGIFSVYNLFAAQLLGQTDLVVGVNVSGRMQSDLERIVGMFVKTLPVRYQLDFNSTVKEMVINMHKYLGEVLSRHVYDVSDIVSDLNRNRNHRIDNLFELCFSYQTNIDNSPSQGVDTFVPLKINQASSHYPLLLYVSEEKDRFKFQFTYLNRFFSRTDIQRMADEFIVLLEKVTGDMDKLVIEHINTEITSPLLNEEDFSINL